MDPSDLVYEVVEDLRFAKRYFLYTTHKGKVYGASFVDRRFKAEAAIEAAILFDEEFGLKAKVE